MMKYFGAGLDKQSNPAEQLRSTLRGLEEQHIGEISPELTQARNCLLDVLPTFASVHTQFGRVLYGYKKHFKAIGGWIAAAHAIASVMGCSAKTIYRITHDYEEICRLDPVFLEALEDQGIDPAARKNAEIVAEIVKMPTPSAPEEAGRTVAAVVRANDERRRAKRARRKEEKEQHKNLTAKQESKAKENEIQLAGQMLEPSSAEMEEAPEAFALRIAAPIERRLQRVSPGLRMAELSRILALVGKTLGVVVTVGKFPPRRILPPKPWETGDAA